METILSILIPSTFVVMLLVERAFPARPLPKVRFWLLKGLLFFTFFRVRDRMHIRSHHSRRNIRINGLDHGPNLVQQCFLGGGLQFEASITIVSDTRTSKQMKPLSGARCGNIEQPLVLEALFLTNQFLQTGIDAISICNRFLNGCKQ